MDSKFYKKTLYTTKASWILSEIFEYDIAKANISILLEYGYISPQVFNMYSQMNRINRQIAIGRLQQDKTYSSVISRGFEESRRKLYEANDLNEDDIIAVKKDAVYTLKKLNVTDFGAIHFTLRSKFRIFISIMNLEIYFYWNEVTDEYDIQIKGINDDKLYYHQYMISSLCDILRYVQIGNINEAIKSMFELRIKYINKELEPEYYREFNNESMFRISNSTYYVFDLTETEKLAYKELIDSSFNNVFLTELHGILVNMKFAR